MIRRCPKTQCLSVQAVGTFNQQDQIRFWSRDTPRDITMWHTTWHHHVTHHMAHHVTHHVTSPCDTLRDITTWYTTWHDQVTHHVISLQETPRVITRDTTCQTTWHTKWHTTLTVPRDTPRGTPRDITTWHNHMTSPRDITTWHTTWHHQVTRHVIRFFSPAGRISPRRFSKTLKTPIERLHQSPAEQQESKLPNQRRHLKLPLEYFLEKLNLVRKWHKLVPFFYRATATVPLFIFGPPF